ncbi:MAG: hypothetical protein AAFV53_20540 [Myxococcota bacterium]
MAAANAVWLLTLALGCTPSPETLADCAALAEGPREECRFTMVEPMLSDMAAVEQAVKTIPESLSRDVLLYRLAVAHPDRASHLCRMTETAGIQEKCRQVLGRPHLSTRPRPKPPQ